MINNFAPIGLIRFSLPSSVFWTIEFCPPSSLYVSAPKKFMEVNWEFIRPHEDGGPDEYWCLFLRWWLVDHRVQFLKLENSRGLKAETAVSGDGPGVQRRIITVYAERCDGFHGWPLSSRSRGCRFGDRNTRSKWQTLRGLK